MAKNVVAIVGRPNVGKSTFFNRCIGRRHAIVDDRPGVTRDRLYIETDWSGHDFVLIDTGGIITDTEEPMAAHVRDQVRLAIDEADVIVFMVDGKEGPTGQDEDVANMLRRSAKPVILAVNKIDRPAEETHVPEFFALGLGQPYSLSAMRGTGGVGDLLDLVVEKFKGKGKKKKDEDAFDDEETTEEDRSKEPFSIAIVGKPNVGKSSILNVLCGKDRTIVSPEPGTTRDAIDTPIKFHGRDLTLIDTAGIRRKSKVDYGIEAFSVVRSIRAIDHADVVVHVIDAAEPITDQDQKIAGKIEEAGRAVVIVFNKWDLIENKSSRTMNAMISEVKTEMRHVGYAEVVFTSALTKTRVSKILEACERAYEQTHKRISTNLVNQVITEAVALVPPPASKRGKRLKVYYGTQVSAAPPTFILFVNDEKLLPSNYKVYLERKIRESFGFAGTPIRIAARPKKESR
ncbi:MAG: ribosome biogenesis GTPase Der [Candidatus Obscuribacterales bacterium]|nr:ribosome biogenesis GTPase Der [Candidatus Obscuribacterales bacterium]